MLEKIKNYFLKRFIANNNTHRDRTLCSLDDAKSIAMICQITTEDSYKHFYALFTKLHERQRSVWMIGYIDEKTVPYYCLQQLSADYFSKKNLNWYGKPDFAQLNDFLSKDFDILIDFSDNAITPIRYCIERSNAHFIVGAASENRDLYDLFIDVSKDQKDNNQLLKNIQLYTKKLHGQ